MSLNIYLSHSTFCLSVTHRTNNISRQCEFISIILNMPPKFIVSSEWVRNKIEIKKSKCKVLLNLFLRHPHTSALRASFVCVGRRRSKDSVGGVWLPCHQHGIQYSVTLTNLDTAIFRNLKTNRLCKPLSICQTFGQSSVQALKIGYQCHRNIFKHLSSWLLTHFIVT